LPTINLLFSVLLTSFGSYGLVKQVRELVRAWSSRRWPVSEAVVVSAAVHERRGTRGRTEFEPTIEFRYRFRDREYVGHRVAFGDIASRNRKDAENTTKKFGPGTRWEVSICDTSPELSVLHPGLNSQVWWAVLFFLGYTGLAVSFLVDALRRVRS
jgi:hypothetical protein